DADEPLLDHGAVDEADGPHVGRIERAVGDEADGEALVHATEVAERRPCVGGSDVDRRLSDDGCHVCNAGPSCRGSVNTAAMFTIGEFSRATHLSVKALRHYDEIGLLVPADVDPSTGYRYYQAAQVPSAHLIKRLRDLDMPLPRIRDVLVAPDTGARDSAISDHLERMESTLQRTQETVAALRSLLAR